MKKFIKYLCGLTLLSILCVTTTSCEDMLSPDSERHTYKVAQDTLYSYWGIIKSLQNVAERYVVLGECRGGLVSGTGYVSDTIDAILKFNMESEELIDGKSRYLNASDYYHIINSCNAYLSMYDQNRITGTQQPYMKKEAAQVVAIRAWTYLQLVQVYGRVPFFTDAKLTTNDISNFMDNPTWLTVDNLITELEPSLTEALQIELQYGAPQYDKYEDVCDASKIIIPLNLILGDIYLTGGQSKADYEKAAEYYYNYLSNHYQGMAGHMTPGAKQPTIYYCYGYKGEGMDNPQYGFTGERDFLGIFNYSAPWRENSSDNTVESITAIPSSTNKLWGTVLRGVNELYGYSSEISVKTEKDSSDSTKVNTSASIVLTAQYDVKQLAASQSYFDLCNQQTYELYIGNANDAATGAVSEDPEIGDTRQYWVKDNRMEYPNGLSGTEKFITKLNPYGAFSTVAHVIYRRSMVWLRYAEALNRAGYPSYAFAILKNGLCKNDNWFPSPTPIEQDSTYIVDYAVTDSAYVFFNAQADSLIYPGGISIKGKDKNISLRQHILDCIEKGIITESKDSLAELDTYLAGLVADGTLTDDDVAAGRKLWVPLKYKNYPDKEKCHAVLYYLDRREVEKAPNFLNFATYTELNGCLSSESVIYRTSLTAGGGPSSITIRLSGDDKITRGIHSHGCGVVRYDDRSSSYNYVDRLIEMSKYYPEGPLTEESIYDGTNDDLVTKCVEDLIVDEEALELAFEGTRFFDLMRVALRRNNPEYLASRVSGKYLDDRISGTGYDNTLYTKLQNKNNWYFRLPAR